MPRPIHFEIQADDPARASHEHGAEAGRCQAVIGYVCSGDVPNVDDYVGKVTATGGKICVPKMPIPGVGWLAYATESEGIILGMMQSDPAAK